MVLKRVVLEYICDTPTCQKPEAVIVSELHQAAGRLPYRWKVKRPISNTAGRHLCWDCVDKEKKPIRSGGVNDYHNRTEEKNTNAVPCA